MTFSYMFVVEEISGKKTKNFLHLMKIPGCVLILIHCVFGKIASTSRVVGIEGWLESQVKLIELKKKALISLLFIRMATI